MQLIRIKVRGFDNKVVDISVKKIIDVCRRTGARVSGPVPLPTRIKRWTVLRSTNIDKRSQESFEIRVSIRLIDILEINDKTIDALRFLELPSGVSTDIQILNK